MNFKHISELYTKIYKQKSNFLNNNNKKNELNFINFT